MSSFTTQPLMGQRVMVRGTDSAGVEGSCVLSSAQWEDVKTHQQYDQAEDAFTKAVDEFFAPLIAAAEAANKQVEKKADDPMSYVVLKEEVDSVMGTPAQLIRLDRDSIILRLIEAGDTDRLVWVNDQLEVAEAPAPATTPVDEAAVLD
jgi:hypothetical protein